MSHPSAKKWNKMLARIRVPLYFGLPLTYSLSLLVKLSMFSSNHSSIAASTCSRLTDGYSGRKYVQIIVIVQKVMHKCYKHVRILKDRAAFQELRSSVQFDDLEDAVAGIKLERSVRTVLFRVHQ